MRSKMSMKIANSIELRWITLLNSMNILLFQLTVWRHAMLPNIFSIETFPTENIYFWDFCCGDTMRLAEGSPEVIRGQTPKREEIGYNRL